MATDGARGEFRRRWVSNDNSAAGDYQPDGSPDSPERDAGRSSSGPLPGDGSSPGHGRIAASVSGPLPTSASADHICGGEEARQGGSASRQEAGKDRSSGTRRRASRQLVRQGSRWEDRSPANCGSPKSHSPPLCPLDAPTAAAQGRSRTEKALNLSEVQLTKNFLKKEIEARSEKISVGQPGFLAPGALRAQRPEHKLFVVSAKLPFTVVLGDDGALACECDPFDMNIVDQLREKPVTAVLVGAPVVRRKSDRSIVVVNEALQEQLEKYLREELKVVPVFPPPGRHHYADLMIWPLFHYSLPDAETGVGAYDWEGYQLINEKFCAAVLEEFTPGDLVWINDYQLMLLPKLIRNKQRDAPIGFYLHCVFPSGEVYRILPQREDILRGVLSSNIIGFHNFQYAQHFLTSCIHVLGLECTASGIEACEDAGGTYTKVVTVPLGIDLTPFHGIMDQTSTYACLKQIKETFGNKKLLVAIDSLYETKGIRHKMMAFHKFLTKNPEWASECVLVQVVTEPADLDQSEHNEHSEILSDRNRLLQQLYEMVGGVNSKFGRIGHLPVHFLCQDVSHTDVAALMSKANVMIDTPLRDMLTRSAHEFLVCQEESSCGVLILSEFSGNTQSLRAAALCVNPWDTNQFADAIQEALEMEFSDRVELFRYGRKYVHDCTLTTWASNFLEELQTAESECETERLQIPPQLDREKLVSSLRQSSRRIVVTGFSGTLLPRLSRKTRPKLNATLLGNLMVLAEDPNTHLVVISGLGRDVMYRCLGHVPCWLIAEGGVCWREPGGDEWHSNIKEGEADWLDPCKEIMEYFAARTPGSTVIEMPSSVSWNYQKTQSDHAAIQSKDLLIHLWSGPLLSAPGEVVVDMDSVTVRPTSVGKALQLEKCLQHICCEEGSSDKKPEWLGGDTLVVCVGDFLMRDEDIFVTLQKFFEPEGTGMRKVPSRSHLGEQVESHFNPMSSWEDQHNLEANSKSLGTGLSQYKTLQELSLGEEGGLWGFAKGEGEPGAQRKRRCWSDGSHEADAAGKGDPPLLKKTPSEPDLQTGSDPGLADDWHVNWETGEVHTGSSEPAIFTCTVCRKATRAAWHLCDTNDVAFLIAQMARELRQAKQAEQSLVENAPRDSGS